MQQPIMSSGVRCTHVLVAEVEDKLLVTVVLPPGSRWLRQSDVELQGGVGRQVGQVTGSTDLNTGRPVELHRHTHLGGGRRRRKLQAFVFQFQLQGVCVCV